MQGVAAFQLESNMKGLSGGATLQYGLLDPVSPERAFQLPWALCITMILMIWDNDLV